MVAKQTSLHVKVLAIDSVPEKEAFVLERTTGFLQGERIWSVAVELVSRELIRTLRVSLILLESLEPELSEHCVVVGDNLEPLSCGLERDKRTPLVHGTFPVIR